MDELTCQELVELVTDYLEGTLPSHRLTAFEEHLHDCEGCTRYLEQMRITIRTVGKLSEQDITPAAQEELLHVFRDWKANNNL
jgi:predicted anti-sigma-YlaC factor YlaD